MEIFLYKGANLRAIAYFDKLQIVYQHIANIPRFGIHTAIHQNNTAIFAPALIGHTNVCIFYQVFYILPMTVAGNDGNKMLILGIR